MPIGQLIGKGIGSPATIPILVLHGLTVGGVTPVVPSAAGTILIGVPTVLAADIIYALPTRSVNIEWIATLATDLEVSINRVDWIVLDSAAVAGTRFVSNVAALFIRPTEDVTVIMKRFRDKL